MSVYNGGCYIGEAVNSILKQTISDWEFLIVDDASTDDTAAILKNYASHDRRIRIYSNANNLGMTKSLNLVARAAKSELLARQDADDISAPNRLDRQMNYMGQHPDVAVVGSLSDVFTDDRIIRKSKMPEYSTKGIKKYLATSNIFIHGSVMMRKSCMAKVGFYREFFRYAQDYDLWLRLSQYFDLAILDEHLYKYRVTADAVSVSCRITQQRYGDIARKLHAERIETGKDSYDMLVSSYPDGLPVYDEAANKYDYHICIAKEYMVCNKLKDARRELWEAWKLGGRKRQIFYLFFKSLLGANLLDMSRRFRNRKYKA